jgi:hypothetical protein
LDKKPWLRHETLTAKTGPIGPSSRRGHRLGEQSITPRGKADITIKPARSPAFENDTMIRRPALNAVRRKQADRSAELLKS